MPRAWNRSSHHDVGIVLAGSKGPELSAPHALRWPVHGAGPHTQAVLAVRSPSQALHLLLQDLGQPILGSQLPAIRHHSDGADVHGTLGAVSVRLATLGVLGGDLHLHLEDGIREHRLRQPHLQRLGRQVAVGAHNLARVLAGVRVVLLGEDGVGHRCLHGAGEDHCRRSTCQCLLGKGLDVLHVLIRLLDCGRVHTVQLSAACHQVVAVVGPCNHTCQSQSRCLQQLRLGKLRTEVLKSRPSSERVQSWRTKSRHQKEP